MFEISSEFQMKDILPALQTYSKRVFGRKSAQIFAPLDTQGNLIFGYFFARSMTQKTTRSITNVRGVSSVAAYHNAEGRITHAVTVSNEEVQNLMRQYQVRPVPKIQRDDFVKILTGAAANYCGTVVQANKEKITIEVLFPTGRKFIVRGTPASVELLPSAASRQRTFWGLCAWKPID
jgi:transcription antitermination factor NusG